MTRYSRHALIDPRPRWPNDLLPRPLRLLRWHKAIRLSQQQQEGSYLPGTPGTPPAAAPPTPPCCAARLSSARLRITPTCATSGKKTGPVIANLERQMSQAAGGRRYANLSFWSARYPDQIYIYLSVCVSLSPSPSVTVWRYKQKMVGT